MNQISLEKTFCYLEVLWEYNDREIFLSNLAPVKKLSWDGRHGDPFPMHDIHITYPRFKLDPFIDSMLQRYMTLDKFLAGIEREGNRLPEFYKKLKTTTK